MTLGGGGGSASEIDCIGVVLVKTVVFLNTIFSTDKLFLAETMKEKPLLTHTGMIFTRESFPPELINVRRNWLNHNSDK